MRKKLWETNPEYAELLVNPEDGYKYSYGSNVKLYWNCPYCGELVYSSPNKLLSRKNICNKCSNSRSYPEKIMYMVLYQLYIPFEVDKIFDWSERKKYDFYIPQYNIIIEINGMQHYKKSQFSYKNGKDNVDEFINDVYKKDLAEKYGKVKKYYIIDCRKSDLDYIRNSIINSGLFNELYCCYQEINWNWCEEYARGNELKIICKEYMNGKSINDLCDLFPYSYNSIKNKLKQGSKLGLCNYNPKEAKRIAHIENGKRILETMCKPVLQLDKDNNFINEFPSIQEAQRQLNICHIWDCVVGKRNTAGGYIWKYKVLGEI